MLMWGGGVFQDRTLTTALKNIPGVPLLYIILNTIVLDKPSQRSLDYIQDVQMGELVNSGQQQKICSLKEEQGIHQKDKERQGRKRKRKQISPNPLSCLKKKKKKGVPTPPLRKPEGGEQQPKRKRSRHKRQARVLCPPEVSDGQPWSLKRYSPQHLYFWVFCNNAAVNQFTCTT